MSNQLTEIKGQNITSGLDTFGSITGFEATMRMAKALSSSTIVPTSYQGEKGIGNCIIALDVASRVNLSPIMVMQNLYVVNGRPSWGAQSTAAMINSSRKYAEPLKYNVSGTGDNLSCFVTTKDYDRNVVKGPVVTMKMAKEEGWVSKSGSKWKTMPEVMIQYRAVSFFGRLHCSEILLGIYGEDEIKDSFEPMKITVDEAFIQAKEEIKENANKEIIDIEPEAIDAEIIENGDKPVMDF